MNFCGNLSTERINFNYNNAIDLTLEIYSDEICGHKIHITLRSRIRFISIAQTYRSQCKGLSILIYMELNAKEVLCERTSMERIASIERGEG